MKSVSRKLALAVLVTLGAAACGDKVTVPPATTTTPRVHSVTVSPSSATIAAGGSFTFGAAVDADATLARTVTWSAAGGTGVTVSTDGVASASSSATGVASICATSTADATVKGCASLTISGTGGGTAIATVEINAITVGCDALSVKLSPAGCGLQTPVATNNVFGQVDVQVNVNRSPNSGVTGVALDVLSGATFTTVDTTYTETLTGDVLPQSDALALQQTQSNRVVFSVQTAAYSLNTSGGAVVKHLNGQKKFRVRLLGGTGTAQAETQLTFRNVNGFHVSFTSPTGNNPNGFAVRQTSAAGFSWLGGTPLTFTVAPVNYTGVAITGGSSNFFATFGSGCNIGPGPAFRASAGAPLVNGAVTGTLTYTNVPTNGLASNLDGYEMSPTCAVAGEVPGGNGVDASGNSFITIALGGNFGPFNTLNNPIGPVVATLPTVPTIRLDNNGPNPITGYAPNPNGRLNGWVNGSVAFDKLNLAAVLASANPTQTAAADVNGIVLPTGVGTNLPVDNGFGGATSFRARGGGTVGGTACNAPVGQVPFLTVANCATFASRTSVTTAPALPETDVYFTDGLIVQSIDAFGNNTNPPAVGGGFNIANPFDPAHPLAANGVLIIGVDVTAPTLVALGGNGSTATTGSIQQLGDATGSVVVGANSCTFAPAPPFGAAIPGGNAGKCWDITAQDQATALPAIASGIATIPGVQGELWVSMQRRDAGSSLFWCPVAVFPAATAAGSYQQSGTTCASWLGGATTGTTFNMAAGFINPSYPVGAISDAYYGVSIFTRDQAGNQSTSFARQFVHDATQATAAPPNFSPAVLPATGTVTYSAGISDNLDIGRGAFTLQFPLLVGVGAATPQLIRLPWANKTTGATNPTGWLFDGPSLTSATLSSTGNSIRSVEVVTAGGAFPTFVLSAVTGAINNPGIITNGITQAQAQLTNVGFFAQSVARWNNNIASGAANTGNGTLALTGVSLAQTGMPGGAAYFANQSATVASFAGMGWAIINPGGNPIDISGNAGNNVVNSKSMSAVAVGHVVGQVLPNPFPGGVKFYAVDTRQNLIGFPQGAAPGTALVEVCTAGTPLNDQVANSWTFTCTYNPSGSTLGVNFDFAGFSAANAANLYGTAANPATTLSSGQGHLGTAPYATTVSLVDGQNMAIVAIGFSSTANGLATLSNNTAGFNMNR